MWPSLVKWSLLDLGAAGPVTMLSSFNWHDIDTSQNVDLLICNGKHDSGNSKINMNVGVLAVGFLCSILSIQGLETKITGKWQQVHEKMLSVASHQGDANLNHSEISPHTCQNGYHQKHKKQQMLVRM